ncbi:MAG: hypothetical protein EAZ06_08635 [Cytophagales bacterium]|nr:MAG: hypothetical protein EAZ06_08635 [Cytophagales bacterium]
MEIWKFGNLEIWKFGNLEIWKFGNIFHNFHYVFLSVKKIRTKVIVIFHFNKYFAFFYSK